MFNQLEVSVSSLTMSHIEWWLLTPSMTQLFFNIVCSHEIHFAKNITNDGVVSPVMFMFCKFLT